MRCSLDAHSSKKKYEVDGLSNKSGNLGRLGTGDRDLGRQVKFTARSLVEITSRPCAIDERRGLEQSGGLSNVKICGREVFKQVLEGMVI